MTFNERLVDTIIVTHVTLEAPAMFKPVTSVQTAALDLYRRGVNVIPLPRPEEVRAWAELTGGDAMKKPPYLNSPFFTSRLHYCGPECHRRHSKTGKDCLPEPATFLALFEQSNIGAMMGRLSENLFALDCDSQLAFRTMKVELDARSIQYWAYSSHRGGNFLMRLAEGEAANVSNGGCFIPDLEILGNRKYVVLPPSVHPTGSIYQWLTPDPHFNLLIGEKPPLVHLADVEFISVKLAKHERSQYQPPEPYGLPPEAAALSRTNRLFLALGTTEPGRNNAIWAAACDLAGCGIDYNLAEYLLLDAGQKCTPPYPDREVLQRLRDAYRKKPEPARAMWKHNSRPHEAALAFTMSHDWRGRTAQTDRAVFLACCQRASQENRRVFRASVREIAELANITPKTANASLHRHRDAGRLKFEGSDETTGANLFSFTDDVITGMTVNTTLYPPVVCGVVITDTPKTDAAKDAFFRQSIAWRVWTHLLINSEHSISAISRSTRIPRSSVKRAIDWLVPRGFVTIGKAEGMYYGEPKTDGELEKLAAVRGTLGKSANRKRYHHRERERRLNLQLAAERARWRARFGFQNNAGTHNSGDNGKE